MAIAWVGIIGQGRSGRNIHGMYLRGVPRKYRIAAVADLSAKRRQLAAEEYGCDVYKSHRELIERDDMDLVINATPSHKHVEVTLDCLAAGQNVLCEKPAAASVADFDKVCSAADKAGKLFAIFQNWRYLPYFQQAMRVVKSGVLGRIVLVRIAFNRYQRRWDWQTLRRCSGGNLLNTGPHPVDHAVQFLGTDSQLRVACVMDRAHGVGDAEDHVKAIITAKDKPTVDLEISSCCTEPPPVMQIYGTRGGLVCERDHVRWRYHKGDKKVPDVVSKPYTDKDGLPAYCADSVKWVEREWELKKGHYFDASTAAYYNMLHRVLTKGALLEVTHDEVRQQIAIIEECHRQNPPRSMPFGG